MTRRGKAPDLTIRVSFEAARIAPQCLAKAYERLVPIPRRPTRPTRSAEATPGSAMAINEPMRRRAEHE